jgi:hypothetical protein
MIESLTKEQMDYVDEIRKEFIGHALDNNKDIDKEACEKYIKLVYSLDENSNKEKLDSLKFIYVSSPFELQEYLNLYASSLILNREIREDNKFDEDVIRHAEKNTKYYSLSYYTSLSNYTWVSFFKYFERIGILKNELFKNYSDLFIASNIYEWAKLENRAVVCRKPKYIKRDDSPQPRLHCLDGAAVEWYNGDKHFFIKGIEVPEHWTQGKVSLKDIEKSSNTELRRIAMELYGYKNYIVDVKAQKVSQDEWGELYVLPVENDEPIVMVSVLNSTCEPYEQMGLEQREEFRNTELENRGQWYKRYLLRVPPQFRDKKPLDALAWTHDMTAKEYAKNLLLET